MNLDFGYCLRSAPNSGGSGPGIAARIVSLRSERELPEPDWSISRMMGWIGEKSDWGGFEDLFIFGY